VSVQWNASTDAGGVSAYNVYRNGTLLRRVSAPTTSTSDTGLAASTTYSYAVEAIDGAGNVSALSGWVTLVTPACGDSIAPTVPTNFRAVAVTCNRVDLFWSQSTDTGGAGLKGYKIYRNGVFFRGLFAPAGSTSDSTVGALSTNSYAVSAIDNVNNESARTPLIGVTTGTCTAPTTTTTRPPPPPTTTTTTTLRDTVAPSVPTGVAANPTSCSQVRVVWSPSTDPGGSGLRAYNLYRNGTFLKQILGPATSTTDVGLAGGTVYGYAVAAVDNAGNQSARSATASTNTPACPDTTPPSVPAGLSATVASCSRIDVAWAASTDTGGSGLRGYRVFRNGTFQREVLAPSTGFADTGLGASTAYSYAVSAIDGAGNQSALSPALGRSTPACTGGTLDPALVGFVPAIGGAKDVLVNPSNGRAYVASMEFGLAVASVSPSAAPVALGASNPPFYGERVALTGSLAVLTGNSSGLKVVDVSSPATPRTVGQLAGVMSGVAASGSYAYVLVVVPGNPGHTDLAVVDLRTPSAPAIVGRVTLLGGYDVTVVGSLAYVAAGTGGLQIVDVGNPAAPRIVGRADTPGTARGVAIGNGNAYVADDGGVYVINVANPAQPAVRGSLATPATALAVAGTRLYVIGGTQVKVVDVANGAAPVLLGASSAFGAQRVAAVGTTAYLASPEVDVLRNLGGLYVFDMSSPASPRAAANAHGRFDDTGIATSGSLAVVTGNSHGLRVIDVSAPATPRRVGALAGTMNGVSMAGQYAHVLLIVPGNPGHTDLAVVDLRTPSAPAIVGRVTLPGGMGIETVGTLAYVAAGSAGLSVVDVATPTAPRIVGTAETPGFARGVAVANGYAYVADESSVQVVDVTSPARPVVRASVSTAATAIGVGGSRLAVIGGLQLKLFDVANPLAPAQRSASDALGGQAVRVNGTALVLATPAINHFDPTGGVYVFDVADLTRPRFVEQVYVPGTTRVLSTTGNFVYAGDAASTLDVITLTR
jgi:fibronectin type 3 domain-containing protein